MCDVIAMAATLLRCNNCCTWKKCVVSFVLGLLFLAQVGPSIGISDVSSSVVTVVDSQFLTEKAESEGNVTGKTSSVELHDIEKLDIVVGLCPSAVECSKLGGECINCTFNKTCVYGEEVTVTCTAINGINCLNDRVFNRTMICRYCYQVETWEQTCQRNSNCIVSNPRKRYLSNCTVKSDVICLGNRTFGKYIHCNWTAGYKWTTALLLSITLGGFGADRFYLGHWQEGIGKLFSFGGLGVWTLLDVILIAVGYLGPADGSLYIW